MAVRTCISTWINAFNLDETKDKNSLHTSNISSNVIFFKTSRILRVYTISEYYKFSPNLNKIVNMLQKNWRYAWIYKTNERENLKKRRIKSLRQK